jgi:hypothetical protein
MMAYCRVDQMDMLQELSFVGYFFWRSTVTTCKNVIDPLIVKLAILAARLAGSRSLFTRLLIIKIILIIQRMTPVRNILVV